MARLGTFGNGVGAVAGYCLGSSAEERQRPLCLELKGV